MIPRSKNGLPALGCISAMQKCIRRGMEKEAMQFAVELLSTSKQFHTMVCNRLEIISHEDIDTQADPRIVPFVAVAMYQARTWYDPEKMGKSRMAIGNAIRLMARAQKSREGDHSTSRSASPPSSRASSHRSPIGRTTCTRLRARRRAEASTISGRRAPSSIRDRMSRTPTRRSSTG
jgi:replication-associated recombination protein RarA